MYAYDCVGHYGLTLRQQVTYCISTVVIIFSICSVIDIIRKKTLENLFFKWYDTFERKCNSGK